MEEVWGKVCRPTVRTTPVKGERVARCAPSERRSGGQGRQACSDTREQLWHRAQRRRSVTCDA
eukprot:412399-Prymnesium_polylepis.1